MAAGSAHSAVMASVTSEPAEGGLLFVFEEDGVNDGVSPLGGFNRSVQRFFASAVHAVRENHNSFASRLLLHQFIGSKIDGVIKVSAASSVMAIPTASAAAGRNATLALIG